MDDLVSIIVPVYNAAAYLERLLDALAVQTHSNIEVILVDDGSTDSSSDICDARCNSDKRFRVIHLCNGGAASARNAGLALCHGSWIMCCDADDLITKDAVELLLKAAISTGSYGAICNSTVIDPDSTLDSFTLAEPLPSQWDAVSSSRAIQLLYSERYSGCGPWAKLLSSEAWSSFSFPQGRRFEDFPVLWQLFCNEGSIALVSQSLYGYRKGIDSVTSRASVVAAADMWSSIKELEGFSSEFPREARYAHAFHLCITSMRLFEMAALGLNGSERNQYEELSISMFKRHWRDGFSEAAAPLLQRIRILVFWLSPALSVFLKRRVSVQTSANWG